MVIIIKKMVIFEALEPISGGNIGFSAKITEFRKRNLEQSKNPSFS